jgi:hypothetical protein
MSTEPNTGAYTPPAPQQPGHKAGEVHPGNARTVSRSMLPVAIIVSSLLGCMGFWFGHRIEWTVPDSLAHVNAMSSTEELELLAATERSNLWNNSWMKYTLAGIGFGVGLFLLGASRGPTAGIIGLILGPAFGWLAGVLGLMGWKWLDAGQVIPFIGEGVQPLVADSLLFAFVSIVMSLPFLILLQVFGDSELRQKAAAIPLAGLLTGLLVPFVGTLVLPTYASTGIFPFEAGSVSLLWFISLGALLLAMTTFTKSKEQARAAKAGAKLGAT